MIVGLGYLLLLLIFAIGVSSSSSDSWEQFEAQNPREICQVSALSDEPVIRFGGSISSHISDDYSYYGTQMKNGWTMFAEWVNIERGGIMLNDTRHMVSLSYMDDFMDESFAEMGLNHLMSENSLMGGLDFLLGPYSSAMTKVAQEVAIAENKVLGAAGASVTHHESNNTFYTLLSGEETVLSYFKLFAYEGAESISVIREEEIALCIFEDVMAASLKTGVKVLSYNVTNTSLSSLETRSYLNGLVSDTILVCSRRHLCESVTLAFESGEVTYAPKGIAMSPCSSLYQPAYTVSAVPWSFHLNFTGKYTGWSPHGFYDRYFGRFQSQPSYHAASAFSSAVILMAAIEATQSLSSNAVIDYICRNDTYFETVYGNCSFGNNRHQCDFTPIMLQKFVEIHANDDEEYSEIEDLAHRIGKEVVVYPPEYATGEFIYPVESVMQRKCKVECLNGTCDASGICNCDNSYYGEFCEYLCVGTVVDNTCEDIRTVYVGGLVMRENQREYISMMELAIELVNNKTDGFFDSTTRVHFEFLLNTTDCHLDTARTALKGQEAWAERHGGELGGLIGPMCSDVSVGIADYGKTIDLPQIGFYSASSELSDPDKFSFYSRTYPSSQNQATLLFDMMEELGLVDLLYILYAEDYLGEIYFNDFSNEWHHREYILLGSHRVESAETDPEIKRVAVEALVQVLQSGSPVVLLAVPFDIAEVILNTASEMEEFDTTTVMWVFSDYFITYNVSENALNSKSQRPSGAVSIYPYINNNELVTNFFNLWESLDPDNYFDVDGDRSTLSLFSPYIVDSFFALADAYQKALEEGNYEDGYILRERVFANLVDGVQFDGLSGLKLFNSFGDMVHPIFNIYYVNNETISVGFVNSTDVVVNTSLFSWPDGSQGKTSAYSKQLTPQCKPGYEPQSYTYLDTSRTLKSCGKCHVGFYKPQWGSEQCTPCRSGMDCNDVGIDVPCLLPGYWRPPDEPPDGEIYSVYSCDVSENCLGGCQFNKSCAPSVDQMSPTCGVCAQGYAVMGGGGCVDCEESKDYLWILFVVLCFVATGVLFLFLLYNATRTEEESDSQRTGIFHNKRLLSVTENIDVDAFMTNSVTTFKLVLSFYQIMTQVVFQLDVDWPRKLQLFFKSAAMFRPSYLSNNFCTDNSAQVYYDVLLLYLLSPLVAFFVLLAVGALTYTFFIERVAVHNSKSTAWVVSRWDDLRTIIIRLCLMFCLIVFPIVTSEFLLYFVCRDFGSYGSFLRRDYSVECNSSRYNDHIAIAILGILIFGLGIPLIFYLVVKNRDQPLFEKSSIVLHRSFRSGYKQFEIVALIHKVILFSVVSFVADPATSSQCLFLLMVDLGYFSLIALCKPYAFQTDSVLALSLTSIECFAFLIAFLIISGVADIEKYSDTEMFHTLYVFTLFSVFLLTPTLYALKFDKVNSYVVQKTGLAVNSVKDIARNSTSRTSNLLHSLRGSSLLRDSSFGIRNTIQEESCVEMSDET